MNLFESFFHPQIHKCFTEKYMSDVTSWQMLAIMFNQLSSLRKENPDYFYKALVCMDLNVNVNVSGFK